MVEAEWQRRLASALLRICAGCIDDGVSYIWGIEMNIDIMARRRYGDLTW
jgi:hypothetical protein